MRAAAVGALAWLGAALALAAVADGPARFVAGDLIVRFTVTSAAGALVTRAVHGDPAAQAQLPALAARLSAELGTALVAVRVTSGSELLLAIDREALLADLAQHVQRDPAVTGTRPLAPAPTVLPPATIALAVEFAPASPPAQLLQRAAAGEHRSRDIDALAARLTAGFDPSPSGQASESGRLVLSLDIVALTLDTIERLQRRTDVEYAQPSQLLRPVETQ